MDVPVRKACVISSYRPKDRNNCGEYISWHRFPCQKKYPEVRKIWIYVIRNLKHDSNWQPKAHSAICSRHFDKKYILFYSKRTILRNDAIPTRFLEGGMTDTGVNEMVKSEIEDQQIHSESLISSIAEKSMFVIPNRNIWERVENSDGMATPPSPAKKRRMDTEEKSTGGVEIPGSSQRCANCDVMFSIKNQTINAIPVGGVNQNDPVPIKKALAFVFESLGQSEDFELENSEFLTETDPFFMCSSCAISLSSLYRAFKGFGFLGSAQSSINLKLTKLRVLNQRGKVWDEYIEYDENFIKEEPPEDEDEFMEGDPLSFSTVEKKMNAKCKVPVPRHLASIEEEPEDELITSDLVLPKTKNTNMEEKSKKSDSAFRQVVKESDEKIKPSPKTQTEECSKTIKPKPGINCSNCAVAFNDKIRKISAISVKGENERNFPVQIKRALTFIFESIGDKLDFPHLKRTVFLTEPPKLLFLCLNCALSLGQLYKTFNHFTDREIFESEIGKNLRQLRVASEDSDSTHENKKAKRNCSNCEIILNEKIRKISAISVSEKSETNTPVPIKEALSFVFESFGEKSEDLLWAKSVFTPSLFLCIDCALSLGQLYRAFKHFTDLGIADSKISDTLKLLRLIFKIELDKKMPTDGIRFTSNEMKYLHKCNKYLLESESPFSKSVAKISDNNKNATKQKIGSPKSPDPSTSSSDSECTTDDENFQK